MNMRNMQVQEQDQHLDEIGDIAKQLHQYAGNMQNEINMQKDLIGDLDRGMDKTTEKMSFVHKKLGVLLKTNDQSQLCMIIILTTTLMILIAVTCYL